MRKVATTLLVLCLAAWYYIGATEHSRRINTLWARADQSGYVGDAMIVYENWRGPGPDRLVGERNRMPIYPGILALFYEPGLSAHAFFERGKQVNILLSMALLAGLGAIFFRYLPRLPAANLLLVVAFGYFVFRAGYVQCELLFYSLLFVTVLLFARVFVAPPGRRQVTLAAGGGVTAALAHLTKASVLPLAGIFGAVFTAIAFVRLFNGDASERRPFGWRLAALGVFAACFLATMYPYISTSKRVFGHYFYNVNTTFYIWYDDWPSASIGTYAHGDGVGWPTLPRRELPGMSRYLREHSPAEIAARLLDGFRDMAVVNYQRYWVAKFVVLYIVLAAMVALAERAAFRALVRRYAGLIVFLVLYAVVYLLAIAFYKPISGTTSRMILAHVAPLLFAISWFVTRRPFRDVSWQAAGVPVSLQHVHLLILATLLFDVAFMLWPRLLADFAGY